MGTGKTYSTKYLLDSNNSSGVAGQVLSTTSTGIDWVDANTVPGTGLWLASGNNIYNSNSGNVGIRTTSPTNPLTIDFASNGIGNITTSNNSTAWNTSSALFLKGASGSNGLGFGISATANDRKSWIQSGHPEQQYANSLGSLAINPLGGNVGIGTTSPGAKLDVTGSYGDVIKVVSGSQNITTNFVAPSTGSGLNNIISTGGEFNIGTSDAQPFDLVTNSISRIAVLSGGNVGIGTTSPNEKLHVAGNIHAYAPSGIDAGLFASTAAGSTTIAVRSSGVTHFNGGNVGIGTTSPISSLNITTTKTVALDTAAKFLTLGLTVDDLTAGDTAGGGGGIAFRSKNTNAGAQVVFGAIDAIKESANVSDFKGSLRFFTNQNSTGIPLERMRIDSTGNVGIGTTSPDAILHLKGSTDTTEVKIDTNDNALGDSAFIKFNAARAQVGWIDAAVTLTDGGGNKDIKLKVNTGSIFLQTNNTSRLTVADGGKVGIGTTSPSADLQIGQGSANVLQKIHGSSTAGIQIFTGGGAGTKIASLEQYFSNEGYLGLKHAGTTKIHLRANGDSYLNTGNVGIGTTSPAAKLEVDSSTAPQILVKNTSGGDAKILFEDSSGVTQNASITFNESGQNTFTIATGYQSSSNANRINIAPAGHVALTAVGGSGGTSATKIGIGTTSPGAKLDVTGNYGDVIKAVSGSQSIVTNFVAPTNNPGNNNIISTGGKFNIKTSDAQPFNILTNSIYRVSILSGGNVGINTTSPSAKLNVNGGIKIEGTNSLSFGGSASIPSWAINSSGNDLIINDQATTSGSVLFNNNEGVALPRLTTTQINAISSPTQGLMAYNTTLNTICFYNGSSWQKVSHANM